MTISPLAPSSYADLPALEGVRLAVGRSAIRYRERDDLLLMAFREGTQAAGVFTRSRTAAAPVAWCRDGLKNAKARALIVNAGNANAFTGAQGVASVRRVAEAVRQALGCDVGEVFCASTGVIGEPLPDHQITKQLPQMKARLDGTLWHEAARAIMTTDTFMKCATREATIQGRSITLNGIAKGSGMIAPDMATLLAFVVTDASIPSALLQLMLEEANHTSFNAITVDGDTSTNDTMLLFATGAREKATLGALQDADGKAFRQALQSLMLDLALQVARDGEGAQKLITLSVRGAETEEAAKRIALTIANSPLVKTAIAGEDANWGRIVAAAGRAGEKLEQEKLSVSIGGVPVAKNGLRVEGYDEAPVNAHMKGRDIRIEVDLGLGQGRFTAYTCDLTHGYIDINGSYRS